MWSRYHASARLGRARRGPLTQLDPRKALIEGGRSHVAREYGTSVETAAPADKVWKVWSDMSTWGEWNPNVSTMDWEGGFVSGSTGTMNTKAGQHHRMRLLDVQPGRSFALETSVVPGTRFRFNCRVEPAGGMTK